MGKRIEINGLFSVTLKVGDIIKFKKESLEFTEEVFTASTASRHEELQALLKKDLIQICKNDEIKYKKGERKGTTN
jgi:Zn finger protein HypA/HybF involved in hydrogenase expression